MGKITRAEQIAEAVERMKMLNIFGKTREEFRRSGTVNISEPCRLGGTTFGALYWIDDDMKAEVEQFEKENNAVVYHVVRSYAEFGTCDSYLYVSEHADEWEYDRADIKDGYIFAYVKNRDYDDCSEFGSICCEERGGGLVRTA